MSEPIRVLYVDDSYFDRELVLDALEKAHDGFKLKLAANRAEFESALVEGGFDVVLSDFNILGFEGLQVLDAVKVRNADIPVIIVTGTGSEEIAAEAIKRGAADYVIKTPTHIMRLPATIHAAFDRQRLEQQKRQTEADLRERVKELRGLHSISQDMEAAGTLDELCSRILERIPPSMQFPDRVVAVVEIDGRRWVRGNLRDDLPPPIQSTVRDKHTIRGLIKVQYTENLPFLLPEEQDFLHNIASALGRWLERKEAFEKAQYQASLLENVSDAIVSTDIEFLIRSWNKGAETMYGWSAPEVLGKKFHEVIPTEYLPGEDLKNTTRALFKSGHWTGEVIQKCKDGRWINVLSASNYFTGEDDTPSGVVTFNRDITERKQAEEALRQTARELEEAQAFAHLGSWRLDFQTGEQAWSAEMYRIFGVEEGSIENRLQPWVGRFVHTDDQRRVIQGIADIQNRRSPEPIEFRIVRPDGSIRWVWAQATDFDPGPKGKVRSAKGILQDITRLKNAETLLRLQGAALESAANAMVIVDMAGVVIWGNRAWTELTGYSVVEAIGQRLNILMPGDQDIVFYEQLWATILGGHVWQGEVATSRKDGSRLLVEQTITPVRNMRGEVEHFIAVLQDVTLRRQAEDTLRRQNAYLNALQETTLGLLSELDLDELLDAIVRRAGELVSTPSAYLALVDEAQGLLIPKVGLGGLQESLLYPLKKGEGLAGLVWQKAAPVLVNNYDNWAGRISSFTKGSIGAIIAVPLFLDSQVCGVLGLAYNKGSNQSFHAGDIDTLEQFARLASLAIKNARLYHDAQVEIEQRKQAEREYRLLLNVTRAIADAETFEDALDVSLKLICENTGLDYGEVWFPDQDGRTLRLSDAFYAGDEPMVQFHHSSKAVHFLPGEGIAGEAWETKRPIWLSDIQANARFSRRLLAVRAGISTAAAIPVYTRDEVVSVIVLLNREVRPDAEKIIDLISSVATQLGHAFERKRAEIELLNYSDVLEDQVMQRTAELKIAKDQADAANRAKSDFLATVSHEIRTPLNGVLGLASLMQQTDLDERQKNYLSKIQASGEILLATINDILDFSKIEAGKLSIESVEFDLDEIFQKVLGLVGFRAQEKGLDLSFHLAPDIPHRLTGDPLRLEQVLLNLVGNAVKFTEKGQVSVTARLQEKKKKKATILFEVEDTGIGMTTAQLNGLYQPFAQADTSTSRKYGGTGLGLTISQRLVVMMGGLITAESAPGHGSRFSFSLTVPYKSGGKRRVSQPEAVVVSALRPAVLRGSRILLVEDNEINQVVAMEMLQGLGVDVTVAASGEQALKTIEVLEFDAILMDIQMPGMDGFEITRRIRGQARYANPSFPIIAMTAHAMTGDRDKVLQSGMNDYIPKPVDPVQMTNTLARWLAGRTAPGTHSQPPVLSRSVSVLNQTAALERLAHNQELYRRLLGMFEQDSAGAVGKIREALQSGDAETARRYAHTLKGTAATIGAEALQQAALQVEKVLAGQDAETVEDEMLNRLEQELQSVLREIRAELAAQSESAA